MDKLPETFQDPTDFKDRMAEKVNEIVSWINGFERMSEKIKKLEEEVSLLKDTIGPRQERRRRRQVT